MARKSRRGKCATRCGKRTETHKAHVDRALRSFFKCRELKAAHAQGARHRLATEPLGRDASFEDVADVLGNTPQIVRKHYANVRQALWVGVRLSHE
jgi:hypothetical protein